MECIKTEKKQMVLFKVIRLLKYISKTITRGKIIYILAMRSIYRKHI